MAVHWEVIFVFLGSEIANLGGLDTLPKSWGVAPHLLQGLRAAQTPKMIDEMSDLQQNIKFYSQPQRSPMGLAFAISGPL